MSLFTMSGTFRIFHVVLQWNIENIEGTSPYGNLGKASSRTSEHFCGLNSDIIRYNDIILIVSMSSESS